MMQVLVDRGGFLVLLVAPALLAVDDHGVVLAELGASPLGGGVVGGLELLVVGRHGRVGDAELLGHGKPSLSRRCSLPTCGDPVKAVIVSEGSEARPWAADRGSYERLAVARGRSAEPKPGNHRRAGVCFGSLMRLVTYDRGGHRRLGAILEGDVVDLPDAVGHPAFPSTLEDLVSSSRGSVLDAARAALQRDDAWNWRVPKPRILTPLFPHSLLSPRAMDVERRIVGPEQPVPWPDGRRLARLRADGGRRDRQRGVEGDRRRGAIRRLRLHARERLAGAVRRRGARSPRPTGLPISVGPCVVTADEIDPQAMFVQVKVDDLDVLKGNLNGTAVLAVRADRGRLETRAARAWRRVRPRPVPARGRRCGSVAPPVARRARRAGGRGHRHAPQPARRALSYVSAARPRRTHSAASPASARSRSWK